MAASGKLVAMKVDAPEAFPAELELLLRSAQEGLAGGAAGRALQPGLDWNELLRLAELHGVEPFLLQEIRQISGSIPADARLALERNCAEIAARNLALGRELIQVSAQLRSRGIDHLVYKGPLLAQMLYGSLALRPSRDIDLLVRPSQAEATFAALQEIGYTDKDNLDSRQRQASIRFASQQCFAKGGIEVDLHWRLAPKVASRSLDVDGIWRRAISATLFDAVLPTLCPEDMFVALCLHAGEHGWSQLSLFCDLAKLLRVSPRFDWDLVRSHLQDVNMRRTVDVTVLLLAKFFEASIPQAFLRREMQVELLAARVVIDFWPTPERSAHKQTSLEWIKERCKGGPFGDRMRWIGGVALTPTLVDFQRYRLPKALQFLYPALRALRLGLRRV